MPDFEIHADYDRDGLLTGSQAERDARRRFPGALVVPNLDQDRRSLPASVFDTSISADFAASLPGQDDELVRVEIRGDPNMLAADERLEIVVTDGMHVRVMLQDRHGDPIRHVPIHPDHYSLARPTSPVMVLFLSVRTIAGARFGRVSNLSTSYRPDDREERDFRLQLIRVGPNETTQEEDEGRFTVAPVILDDRLSPARRLYIVDKDDENFATRHDVCRAARAAGVTVIEAPASLSGGDTWFQDQFQHGYMEGANDAFREIVLHLPRLRSDSSTSTVEHNLGEVVDGHFRAQNVALHNDLWDRIVVIRDANGRGVRVSFRELRVFVNQITQLERAVGFINTLAEIHLNDLSSPDPPRWQAIEEDDWVTLRRMIDTHIERLHTVIDEVVDADELPFGLGQNIKERVAEFVEDIKESIEIEEGDAGRDRLTVMLGTRRITLSDSIALRLQERADQMHSGANYGGNIESTPPVRNAPLGKIIIGSTQFGEERSEFVDPDLLNLLAKQKKQPIVEIDSSWLKVGHIDEMLSVVPHGTDRFSFLHASAKAAMAILRRAEARYLAGLGQTPPADSVRRMPRGAADRLMEDGPSPVTRLFRGKYWLQNHAEPSPGNVRDTILPPKIYIRVASIYGRRQIRMRDQFANFPPQPEMGFAPNPGGERRYAADMTPSEILFSERDEANNESSNMAIDDSVLAASRQVLSSEFPGIPILPVPVLFDRIPNASQYRSGLFGRPHTTAVTPNLANMQVLNGHILVPRPFGPRMRPADAIAVVRGAMEDADMPSSVRARVGNSLIGAHRLDHRYRTWVERFSEPELSLLGGGVRFSYRGLRLPRHVIAAFRDSFPGASDRQLRLKIIQPNHGVITQFGGASYRRLPYRPVQLVLHDRMVDLFELWMAAVADELGVKLHFIDTWFYHLRDGQIHCGTNVLRTPNRGARPHAHEVADTVFRARTLEFEGERIEGA